MKKLTLTFMLLFVSCVICSATTRIVDSHYPRPAGVYETIQLAYNAASSGDTILISPAVGEYAGITITKPIHIVGTGWTNPSASVPHTKTAGFTFNAGSQGSSISGLDINGMIDINTDSITVKRNKLQYIYVRANSTNIVIIQNFISSGKYDTSNPVLAGVIGVWENTEVFISNNIIINSAPLSPYSSYLKCGIGVSYPSNIIITNNIFKAISYSIYLGMSTGNYLTQSVYNNIVMEGSIFGITESTNNIGNSTQFPLSNANQQNVNMTNVFVDAANYDFHLKEGSPAIGAGLGGTDCGIYGGTFPLVDNGRTWLPIITEMSVPTVVNVADGLSISVKAKSGK